MHVGQRWVLLALVLALEAPALESFAASLELGPGDDVEAAIAGLGPGDELILRGGTYTLTERFSIDLAGQSGQPILIRAKDGERPHLHRPNADQNLIDIDRAEEVIIRGLEFSGGSAGLRISSARALTIEDCEIHDTADVALRANDGGATYEGLRILRNHIHDTHDTGEGMYLGCNQGGCRVAHSEIAGNWVHHTNATDVVQGDGIELKEGSHDNVIRDNVVHDTHYPCILTYSTIGNGGPNIIERNVLWGCGDHGIQSAADAVIRNNLILSAGSDGIALQPHQSGAPSNLVVVHNTVLKATNDALSIRGTAGAVVVANNALFAQAGQAIFLSGGMTNLVTLSGNAGLGGAPSGALLAAAITDFVDGHFRGAPPVDLSPAAGGALIAAGDPAHVADDDFNGQPRGGVADIGAYAYRPGGNPGWTIQAGFKDRAAVVPPPADGGGVGDGGSVGDGAPADVGAPNDAGPGADAGINDASGGGADLGGTGRDASSGSPEVASGSCGCRSALATTGTLSSPTWALFLIALRIRRRRR